MKRVVLYKNGVGYFEHVGGVRGSQDVSVSFTSGQLNDVLKSLTVLDLGGGRITGVGYDSSAPASRQLGDLRLPVGEQSSLTEFLGALRGARLEITSAGATVKGRLLSIERKTRMGGGATLEVDYVSLITENGELKTAELTPGFGVKLLETGLSGKVDRYLDLVSADREPDVRRMTVSAEGTGDRSLFVSYISEVPIWKATYRIVLDRAKPLLQGWAIVDNTVGQDWENVEMSLVAGAPQSFIQELSKPYYSRRPLVPLPESVTGEPQTHEAALIIGRGQVTGTVTDPAGLPVAGATVQAFNSAGTQVGETSSDASGRYGFSTLPEEPVRLEIGLPGFRNTVIASVLPSRGTATRRDAQLAIGAITEAVQVASSAPRIQTEVSATGRRRSGSGMNQFQRLEQFRTGSRADSVTRTIDARELGDLFEYKLKEPITIRKNRSALVPIVNSPIEAEKVSIWNDQTGMVRPQRAIWLTNTSNLTLDGGTFSVLEEETFAGEGVFEAIRPAEKRLISFATDLAVNVSSEQSSDPQRVTRVRIVKGSIIQESEIRETKNYLFRNEDSKPRTMIVEHPVVQGHKVRAAIEPAETTGSWHRFRVIIPPKQTVAFAVPTFRAQEATWLVSDLTSDGLAVFVRERTIDASIRGALERVLAQKNVIAALEKKQEENEGEVAAIAKDQERLRENMKALKNSPEERSLLSRYTQQLNAQESRLETLEKESKKIEADLDAAETALSEMIGQLSFDVTL